MELKYLFVVEYNDGTTFEQTENDTSEKDPTKSAFFDVDHSKIKRFSLFDQSEDCNVFSVDLTDGHFTVNGVDITLHDEPLKDFRLIFFRRHRHSFNAEMVEKEHTMSYRIGWQCTVDGKNYQRVMEFK